MKPLTKLDLFTVFLGLTIMFLVYCISDYSNYKETTKQLNQLKNKLEERNYLDSIMYDHLKDCSYIDKSSVKIGHDGYLYSSYHRSNLK